MIQAPGSWVESHLSNSNIRNARFDCTSFPDVFLFFISVFLFRIDCKKGYDEENTILGE